jgi:hypothetical protein
MLERLISQGTARWAVYSRFAKRSPISLLIRLRQGRQMRIRPLKQYPADSDLVLLNRMVSSARHYLEKTYRSQSTGSRVMQCLAVLLDRRLIDVGVFIPCSGQRHDEHPARRVSLDIHSIRPDLPLRLHAELASNNANEIFAIRTLISFLEQVDFLVRASE